MGVGLVALLACTSCEGSTDGVASSAPPSTPAAVASVKATPISPKPKPAPPAAVKAACPLLPVSDLERLLGGNSHSHVVATEDHSEVPQGNSVSHLCTYGKPGADHPFALELLTIAHPVASPAQIIAGVVKGANVPTHRVSGVGEAATFYKTPDGVSTMAAAKRSAGQVRSVIFAAPIIVPEQKFIDVEKLVLSRI
jgi:hypothetical protein